MTAAAADNVEKRMKLWVRGHLTQGCGFKFKDALMQFDCTTLFRNDMGFWFILDFVLNSVFHGVNVNDPLLLQTRLSTQFWLWATTGKRMRAHDDASSNHSVGSGGNAEDDAETAFFDRKLASEEQ